MPQEDEEGAKEYLLTSTSDLKLVADYTGLNFNEILKLDCYTYKVLVKDAFIYKMSQSEAGRDYLENCWILNQTRPDKAKLREHFKQELK